jgi:hypothetical protein
MAMAMAMAMTPDLDLTLDHKQQTSETPALATLHTFLGPFRCCLRLRLAHTRGNLLARLRRPIRSHLPQLASVRLLIVHLQPAA